MLPDLIGEVTHDSQTEPMAPQDPSSKQTFLKQWEPKIAGSKLIVSSQNGGVGGKLSLELQPPKLMSP